MLEAYQKEVEKNENPQPIKPEWEPTLKDILGKKEDSELFGELLAREGDITLASRMAKGELTEDDIASLDHHRKGFLSTMEEVKTVKESIGEDVINAYTKSNPELQKVVALVGPVAYKEIIKEKLAKLAIREPDAFRGLSEAVENKNDYKGGYYKELDEKVSALCAEKGIKAEDYLKALALEDGSDRTKAMRGAVREGYNWFQKAGDWVSAGSWSKSRVKLMESQKTEIDSVLEQMRMHQSNVGGFLSGMIENDEIRSAVARDLIGEKEEKKPIPGFKEARGEMPTKEGVQTKWNAYKETLDKDWEDFTPARQEKERDKFIEIQNQEMAQRSAQKRSFWGSIFEIFSQSFFTNNKAELN